MESIAKDLQAFTVEGRLLLPHSSAEAATSVCNIGPSRALQEKNKQKITGPEKETAVNVLVKVLQRFTGVTALELYMKYQEVK